MAKEDQSSSAREMYPDIEPYDTGHLQVSEIHNLYYEQCGKKDGNPVIVVHGGPGGGIKPRSRRFFDPAVYRIVLLDQRGAGKSTPFADLRENTTWDLVQDMETLRTHLDIDRWIVFGTSWGSTLSLAYAESHPGTVKALVVQGIFALRRRELLWFNQDGVNMLFPDLWEDYVAPIPVVERGDLLSAYYRRLTSEDDVVRAKAAKSWNRWEMATSRLLVDDAEWLDQVERDLSEEIWSEQHARIECHYFIHGGFLKSDNQLLDDVEKIRHIPATIIQGRYDVCCPMETAWRLHKRWPEAEFHVVPDAGHSSAETGIQRLLLAATDKYKRVQ
jgi:proline iminopeptidase